MMTKRFLAIFLAASFLFSAFCVSCNPDDGNSAISGWEDMGEPEEPEEPENPDDPANPEDSHWFKTRGLVFGWSDCENRNVLDYIQIAKDNGINTFSIYNANRTLVNWKMFTDECAQNGIAIEYEEHMLSFLIPRGLFSTHPEYFRQNEHGVRVNDANGCPSCPGAIEEVKKNARKIAMDYVPTNHKYYFWLDDGGGICHCDKCKDLNAAEQALIFENAIVEVIRQIDPKGQVAHLCYYNTLEAPKKVEPAEGIFLEYAPIGRNKLHPLSETWIEADEGITHAEYLRYLNDNMKVFPKSTAQVLEYWMDCSLFSSWDPDHLVEVPWNRALFLDDLKTYAKYGIHHVTCYAAYIGPNYVRKFGHPDCLDEYGQGLLNFEKK